MKKFTLFVLSLFIFIGVFAVPAKRVAKTVKQSDGTELMIYLTGDESFNYYRTSDGVPVVCGLNGDFYYARLSAAGTFVTTEHIAHSAETRTAEEVLLLESISRDNSSENISKTAARRAERYKAPRRSSQTIVPRGEINVPVLLVEFADTKFTFTKEVAQQTFNGDNYKGPENPFIGETVGSLRDYFIAQSEGVFTPNFIVSDVITLDRNMAYYGGNDSEGSDKNPQQMIIDACRVVDADFDFSIFDNDGDGTIEFLYCLYAGYSEAAGAAATTIWPHQWYLSSYLGKIKVDGVYVDNYACSSELSLNEDLKDSYGVFFTGIGSCCHEFSHCLGLPDFYDTSSNNPPNFGMDYWDLMDYGCYNVEGYVPIGYSAYERDFMGWRELTVLTDKGDYSMEALTSGGVGYKIVNEANPNEYYIIENRQKESWDRYIQNSGMLITHVDYLESAWFYNTVNNDTDHQRFTIIPADGETLNYYVASTYDEYLRSLQGDVWPGSTNNTELTDFSTPAATVYTGGYMSKPITNIRDNNGVVTFSFMKGELKVPQVKDATQVTDRSFVANWEEVEDATGYKVTLEYIDMTTSGATETLCSEDFMNVASTGMSVTNPNAFTTMKGWTASNIYTATGAMCIGTATSYGNLITPVLVANGTVDVSFRLKQYSTSENKAQLSVYVLNGNSNRTKVADYVAMNSSAVYSLSVNVPEGGFAIEFSTENSESGQRRVIIDDIAISSKLEYLIEHITTVESETNSYKFENLESGKKYRYSVVATDGVKETERSDYKTVTLLITGIEDVTTEGDDEIFYDLTGRVVVNPQKGIYIMKKGNNIRKVYLK